MEGGPFGEKIFSKKSHNDEKTENDPLVSLIIVCYAEKKEKLYTSVPCAKWSNLAP